jgi:hypothetical protein
MSKYKGIGVLAHRCIWTYYKEYIEKQILKIPEKN